MKLFRALELREADAHVATSGQALHLHRFCTPNAPGCFKAAIARGEDIAHLFDADLPRLIETAKRLGVRVIKVEKRGTARQHIDLCGAPLRKAIATTTQVAFEIKEEK